MKKLLAIPAVLLLALALSLPALAADTIVLQKTAYDVVYTNQKCEVEYLLPSSSSASVYVDMLNTTFGAWTNTRSLYLPNSGKADILGGNTPTLEPGNHTFRLRMGAIGNPDAVSANITVTIKKAPITVDKTSVTVIATAPKATITVTAPTGGGYATIYIDKKENGIWVQSASNYFSTGAGNIDLMKGENKLAAGNYTFRLRMGAIGNPDAVSADIKVESKRAPITVDKTSVTVIATAPAATIAVAAPTNGGSATVFIDKKENNIWVNSTSYFFNTGTGNVDLMRFQGKLAAGNYTYRLRMGAIGNPDAVSADIKVESKRGQTKINMGTRAFTGAFSNTTYAFTKNTPKYTASNISATVENLAPKGEYTKLRIQRKKGSNWETVGETNSGSTWTSTTGSFNSISVTQTTTVKTTYRLQLPASAYVTGGVSPNFTVKGNKQKLTFGSAYVKGSAPYYGSGKLYGNKKITASVDLGYYQSTAKVNVYDGKKKIKTITVKKGKRGRGEVTLPRLSKGKHTIKFEVVPNGTFGKFYKKTSTKVNVTII